MPGAKVFIDTNILLYFHDRRDQAKAHHAAQWLRRLADTAAGCVNLQVLNEAAHVLLRKKWYDAPATVHSIIDDFATLGNAPVTWPEVLLARILHPRFGYSWWDCLLLASALELGCSHFLSEDLQDGQRIEAGSGASLTIVDPFAHSPEHILVPR